MPSGAAVPGCLVLGNFDGVHLGHQAILTAARAEADQLGVLVTAITFEPHPRAVISPGQGPLLLTPLELRRRLLAQAGVDRLWVIPFDERVQGMSPGDFMARVCRQVAVQTMVVGPLFSVGKPGEGKLDFLQRYAESAGFKVRVVEPRSWNGAEVSSSAIRLHLAEGDLEAVREMLGRPLQVLGPVVRGAGLGHQLGFPTANLRISPVQALPPDGVFVMDMTAEDGVRRGAVGSIGKRPHFGGGELAFEVHCLEEPGDLYGREVLVSVLERLRGQAAFSSDGELVEQMARDAEAAAAYLASVAR
jgi:riboflavin kinase/FMN adenylyltransferase